MLLKRQNSWPPGVSALDALNDFTMAETPSGKNVVLIAYKQMTNIMKN